MKTILLHASHAPFKTNCDVCDGGTPETTFVAIPYPDLPDGWEHTNEYRVPKYGEYYWSFGLQSPTVSLRPEGGISEGGISPEWIVQKKVEFCPTCGQRKG